MIFTRIFWKDTTERAISTGAQFALAAIGQDVLGVDLFEIDPANIAGAFVVGGVLTVLKCLAAGKVPGTLSPASLTEL